MAMLWNGTVFKAERCAEGSHFSALILRVSPYLYPFSIEYSILVGTVYNVLLLFILFPPTLAAFLSPIDHPPGRTIDILYIGAHSSDSPAAVHAYTANYTD